MTIVKAEDQVAQPHDVGYKHLLSSKTVFLELPRGGYCDF